MNEPQETVLVTGASGFTGRHLVAQLLRDQNVQGRVVATTRNRAVSASSSDVDLVPLDLTDAHGVNQLIAALRPGRIFHLAGIIHGQPDTVYRTNFQATLNLLTAVARHAPQARVLCVGSAAEYGTPSNPEQSLCEDSPCHPHGSYAVSKYCQTQLVIDLAENQNLRVLVVRPFNLVGPGIPEHLLVGAILARICKTLAEDTLPVIRTGNLASSRDFLDVRDAVSAYIALLETDCWGQVFNICSGEPTPLRWVIETLLSFCQQPPRVVPDHSLFRRHDPRCVFGSFQKLRQQIAFQPRHSLRDSLHAAWATVMETDQSCALRS